MGAALRILTAGAIPYFFIPAQEPQNIRLGVPEEAVPGLLEHLAASGEGMFLSWIRRQRLHTCPAADAVRARVTGAGLLWIHRHPRPRNRRDVLDSARAVVIEVWHADGTGAHQSPVANSYANLVRIGSPQTTRVARTGHELLTFPAFATPDISDVDFAIDAVYLWVDDADPQWRRRRDLTLRNLGITHEHASVEEARFRQHDELRYSLRSLSQYAPWVRHVYLVTDHQSPTWLDVACPRLTVVDHTDLFDGRGALPTYNSHALSAMLHHIPGIADHYLYLNDDFFLGRRTGPQLWFDGNGQPRFYCTRTTADPGDAGDANPLAQARDHTFELVEQLTGRARRRNLQHGPYAMSKELMQELEQRLPTEFDVTWRSQVRSSTDFVVERLHSQVGHSWGRTIDSRGIRYRYFNVGEPASRWAMEELLVTRTADIFCINDAEGPVPPAERGRLIRSFLDEYFPVPSEFEL